LTFLKHKEPLFNERVKASGWFLPCPVGAPPHRQGHGIGSARVREAADRMRKQGATGIVLVDGPGVHIRLGFKNCPGLTYADVPPQHVLALQLGRRRALRRDRRLRGLQPRRRLIGSAQN
jgi:predicted N-acetyltransferase YhbS